MERLHQHVVERLNASPLTTSTNLVDTAANLGQSNAYFVRPVVGGTVNGSSYTYSPGDVSVGELDGDGEWVRGAAVAIENLLRRGRGAPALTTRAGPTARRRFVDGGPGPC
jgi:hypothetical protein